MDLAEDSSPLQEARAAFARGEWSAARDGLLEVQSAAGLATSDLEVLGRAAWWLGLGRETLQANERVYARLSADGDVSGAAMKAVELALMWGIRGDLPIASGWLNRAERALQDRPQSPEHGFLRYVRAAFALSEFEYDLAREYAPVLQDMGRRFQLPALTSLGLVLGGLATIQQGRVPEGFAQLDEAMLPLLADEVPAEWATDIFCTVIHTCHTLADLDRFQAWTEATERWSEHFAGSALIAGVCRIHRLQLHGVVGDWATVEQEMSTACAQLIEMNGWVAGEGFYELGEIRRLRGDFDGALEAYERARGLGLDAQPGEALLRHSQGDTATAWAELRVSLDSRSPMARARLLPAAVEIACSLGLDDRAEAYCTELEKLADTYGTPGFRTWAQHARGALLVRRSQPADALPLLHEAAGAYRRIKARYSTAQVYEWLGRAHADLGDHDLAAADAATAEAIYARLGAEPDLRRLSQDHKAPGGLTAREVEVLTLVSGGATNRQIAQQLVISEKTVGRHLSNIFAKIDVGSRAAAGAWAREHHLC